MIVLYGSSAGTQAEGSQAWTLYTPGVKGKAGNGEEFGEAIAP